MSNSRPNDIFSRYWLRYSGRDGVLADKID